MIRIFGAIADISGRYHIYTATNAKIVDSNDDWYSAFVDLHKRLLKLLYDFLDLDSLPCGIYVSSILP